MTRRITVVIDNNLDKKIHMIQAKKITKELKSVSYSRVLNDILRKAL